RHGANSASGSNPFIGFVRGHGGMGASPGRGYFSFSRGYTLRNSPIQYGMWRTAIAGRGLLRTARTQLGRLNPRRFMGNSLRGRISNWKGRLGEYLALRRGLRQGDTLIGSQGQVKLTVDGIELIPDHVVMDTHGFIKIIESKWGPNSSLTPAQAQAWRGGSV